jgi:putative transcriptional regulator
MPAPKPVKPPPSGEELGRKLLESVREMKARNLARVTEVQLHEVVEARQSTGMSQAEFASALSISKRTLQEWEQGRRSPSGAAQALIRIARGPRLSHHPRHGRAAFRPRPTAPRPDAP